MLQTPAPKTDVPEKPVAPLTVEKQPTAEKPKREDEQEIKPETPAASSSTTTPNVTTIAPTATHVVDMRDQNTAVHPVTSTQPLTKKADEEEQEFITDIATAHAKPA